MDIIIDNLPSENIPTPKQTVLTPSKNQEGDDLDNRLFTVVGESVPMVDAVEKVTGKAKYSTDIALPNMLCGKVLRSPYSHARIKNIDTSAAEKLPGVAAVVTWSDSSGIPFSSSQYHDQYILAKDKVRFVGDEVAAVAAVDEQTAIEALELIKVDYEILPAVYDIDSALAEDAPIIHEDLDNNVRHNLEYERGDIESAWKHCVAVVEETVCTSRQHPAYIEPQSAVVDIDTDGRIEVWASSQIPAGEIRKKIALIVGVPLDDVRVHQTFVGGAFGGKVWQHIVPLTALLAKKANQAVRLTYNRREDLTCTPTRLNMRMRLKMGADAEGNILAKETEIVADNGAYCINSPVVVDTAATRIESLYRFKNISTKAKLVYTNTVPTGTFRGFGNPQGTFMVESVMDKLAEKLGIDPSEIRKINGVKPGDVSAHGWEIKSCELEQCIDKAVEASNWKEVKRDAQYGHGIGMACCIHVNGNRSVSPAWDGANASVKITEGGQAIVSCADGDIGQGASTTYAQIVADVLNIPLEKIRVVRVDTDNVGLGFGAFASRVTYLAGNAVKAAALIAKQKLFDHAALMAGDKQDQNMYLSDGHVKNFAGWSKPIGKVAEDYAYSHSGVPLYGNGYFTPPNVVMADFKTKYGNISSTYSFACHVAEVEVDLETGKIRIDNYVAVHDSGKLINPMLAEGQVVGGVVQGVGYSIFEDYYFDREGVILNNSFLDYKLPTSVDIPNITTIFADSNEPTGPMGAKGIAEITIVPVAAAIGNALYDALGKRVTTMPFTPERVLAAIKNKNDEVKND
ncbi:MAG: xanthine dehydrogenase family protein molybdopterin-binding subunit [Saccharofermentanales bacterium]|jgi:CO/xanthine dehydrogenase Mo-binding subunit